MNKIVIADSSCFPSLIAKWNLKWNKWYSCQNDKSEKLTFTVLLEESAVWKSRGYYALEEYQKVEHLINKLDSTDKTILENVFHSRRR